MNRTTDIKQMKSKRKGKTGNTDVNKERENSEYENRKEKTEIKETLVKREKTVNMKTEK